LRGGPASEGLSAPKGAVKSEDAMISIRVKTALAVFVLLSFFAGASWAQMASGSDADSAGIKQNRHDAHATAMAYVEDGDFSSTTGVPSHGWKELDAHYNEIFTTFLKDAHRTDAVRSIRFLGPGVASVDIDWQMTGARTRDGKDAPNRKGLLTWIVSKQRDGQWKITIYHESVF
jgi:uncharacterized protein (TIGR02246 family)